VTRPPREKVVIAYLHPGMVNGAFAECLNDLIVYDAAMQSRWDLARQAHTFLRDVDGLVDGMDEAAFLASRQARPGRILSGGGRLASRAGANLAGPRNGLVRKFLEYGAADWLWMVDTDMTFPPDTVERLLVNADPDAAPVVGGLCFGFDDKGDVQPTLFGLTGDPEHPQVIRYHAWPPDSMFQVEATGAACLLIHKSALQRMRDFRLPARPGKVGFNDAYPWFQELEHDGQPVGEDIGFCWRLGVMGIPLHVDTSVQLGHIKDRELNMDAYFAQRGLLDSRERVSA
jgi:hypothetical protein